MHLSGTLTARQLVCSDEVDYPNGHPGEAGVHGRMDVGKDAGALACTHARADSPPRHQGCPSSSVRARAWVRVRASGVWVLLNGCWSISLHA